MAKSTVITISRQYGSGGRLIGKKLAEKFDIPFYDKELIELAVEESGFSKEIFEKVDERASSSLLYTLSVTPGLMHGGLTGMADLPLNDKVFLVQTKIIKDVAAKGGCVIVGRCADFILRDRADLLKVFIHADPAFRADRIVRVYGEREDSPEKRIRDKDKRRMAYYRYYTDIDWGVAKNYDICLDSGTIGIDRCADIIFSLF